MNVINLKGKGPDFWNRVLKETDKYVYIGRSVCFTPFRQSKWYNPFSVKKYGRQKSIELYRKYLPDKPELLNCLHEINGKTLCCWCKPEACHGDVLVELVEKLLMD